MFNVVNWEINRLRTPRTVDMVERLAVITARDVELTNHPIRNPTTIFNPGLLVTGDEVRVYARIILGYFTYASAVAEFCMTLDELLGKRPGRYRAEITVYPDNKYDFWGVEDPRVYTINGEMVMTYCGRTVSYFNPTVRVERTLPVTAVYRHGRWKKVCTFRMSEGLRGNVVSDKDAFLMKTKKELLLFHRPHMNDEFYLAISRVPDDVLYVKHEGIIEAPVRDTVVAFEPASFEAKVGWSTPPVQVGSGEHLLLVHCVEKVTQWYKVIGVLTDDSGEVVAVTPHYIMEPQESFEIYGDRPYTVFPCGAEKVDDLLLVSYGAADCTVGIGAIELSELMSLLDSNRVE